LSVLIIIQLLAEFQLDQLTVASLHEPHVTTCWFMRPWRLIMAWHTLQLIIGMLPYPVGVYGGGSSSAATLWITITSCLDAAPTTEIHYV